MVAKRKVRTVMWVVEYHCAIFLYLKPVIKAFKSKLRATSLYRRISKDKIYSVMMYQIDI